MAENRADGTGTGSQERLKQLLAGRKTLPAGRLQFINLEQIQTKFGKQWPHIAERADLLARQIIQRHVTPHDLFEPLDTLAYLLFFGDLSEQQAKVKCGLIANAITRLLLGEDGDLETADIQTVVVEADAQVILETERFEDVLADIAVEADRKAAKIASERADSVQATQAKPFPKPTVDTFSFSYRPLWDVARNVLSTYLCVPNLTRSVPIAAWNSGSPSAEAEAASYTESVDLACLEQVMQDFRDLEKRGRKLLLSCTVHYETLRASKRRQNYLEYCGRLPDKHRELLVFEVAGIPNDVPHARLLELLVPLARYSRARMVRVPLMRTNFSAFQNTRIHVVGVDLGDTNISEAEIFAHINRFVDAADKARFSSFIHGLNSLSLATAAVCAGFDYIDGDSVTSVTSAPSNMYRFQSHDLFRTLLNGIDRSV